MRNGVVSFRECGSSPQHLRHYRESIVTGGGNIHLSQRPPAITALAVDQGGSFPSSAYVLVCLAKWQVRICSSQFW